MSAHVISYRESDRLMVSRLRLESGEKVFVKVELDPVPFVGIWRLGSLNPITIAVDWAISKFTGQRTAGLEQIWGLGADAVGNPETWLAVITVMFNSSQEERSILSCVTSMLQRCRDIEDVEALMREREAAVAKLSTDSCNEAGSGGGL